MAEDEHGRMNIDEQKKTYSGFLKVAMGTIVVVAVILLILTFRI